MSEPEEVSAFDEDIVTGCDECKPKEGKHYVCLLCFGPMGERYGVVCPNCKHFYPGEGFPKIEDV